MLRKAVALLYDTDCCAAVGYNRSGFMNPCWSLCCCCCCAAVCSSYQAYLLCAQSAGCRLAVMGSMMQSNQFAILLYVPDTKIPEHIWLGNSRSWEQRLLQTNAHLDASDRSHQQPDQQSQPRSAAAMRRNAQPSSSKHSAWWLAPSSSPSCSSRSHYYCCYCCCFC